MKEKITTKNIHILIIIIGTIFLFTSSFHTNIWFDEAYSVGMANQTLVDIWKIGGNDVHPVLYYWMLRIVSLLTNSSILAYRLFSVLPVTTEVQGNSCQPWKLRYGKLPPDTGVH